MCYLILLTYFTYLLRPTSEDRVRIPPVDVLSETGTIRYDTKCYFNVRSKADKSQLNLPHGTDN